MHICNTVKLINHIPKKNWVLNQKRKEPYHTDIEFVNKLYPTTATDHRQS